MKYSFILPVYNCESHIVSIVDQISKIDRHDTEIVLIDDGSTDETGVICDSLASNYRNVLVHHQYNQGVSAARNNGIMLSTGSYIIFVDADDSINIQLMEELLRYIDDVVDLDMAIFGMSFDYFYNKKIYRSDEIVPAISGIYEMKIWCQELLALFRTNSLSPIWNKVIKKSILIDNRLELQEDLFLYEDLEFSIRCMSKCNRILFWDKVLYHYRQAEDEGNIGRRLKRISFISDLVNTIDASLLRLLERCNKDNLDGIRKEILLSLFLILIREKNFVSSYKQIVENCNDFSRWFNEQGFDRNQEDKEIRALLEKRIVYIITRQIYIKIRHKLAVSVKSMSSIIHFNCLDV